MSILNFISETLSDVILSPDFLGVSAKYSRTIINEDTGEEIETKETILTVSPQGCFSTADAKPDKIAARVEIIWCKTEELQFDGEPFLPGRGDIIELKNQKFVVESFGYEDATKNITTITTFKIK
jgi:hypothetical protein